MNTLRNTTLAVAAALALYAPACSDEPDGGDTSSREEPAPEATVELPTWSAPTTSPDVATRNLNAALDASQARWEAVGDVASATRLVSWLDLRAQVQGSPDDLHRAVDVAAAAVDAHPDESDAWLLAASTASSVHRFDEADEALDRAASLGADVEAERLAVGIARGDGDREARALDIRADAALAHDAYSRHTDAAVALIAAGRFDDADASFVDALRAYRDVSPFAVAWVQFQRGVLAGEAVGDAAAAEVLYRDAVRLVPDFVVANVHLAELEAARGDVDAAVARLQRVSTSGDPEPWARLAEYLADNDPAAAGEARAEALRRYDRLLDEHELAWADHAAEFFMGAGDDAERAWQLARINLDNRTNDRAYQLAVSAALASDRTDEACRLLEEAGPDRRRIGLVELRETTSCP